MRFVSIVNSTIGKARRAVSQAASVSLQKAGDDKPDMAEVAKVLRQMTLRLNKLEAAATPEPTEFEVNVGTGGTLVEIPHGFSGPVRWWVTDWRQQLAGLYPYQAPILIQDVTSTADTLYLRSYVSGRAVVRVEPSQSYIDPATDTGALSPLGATPVTYLAGGLNGQLLKTVSGTPTWTTPCVALVNDFTTVSGSAVDTGLLFPVKSGEVWQFEFAGSCGDSSANGMKFAINCPTASTIDAMHYTSSTNITTRLYESIGAINTLGNAVHTVAGGLRDDLIRGVVKAGADGNVKIQVATVTATTTTATVAKKSYLRAFLCTEV